MTEQGKANFVKGAAILAAAGIISRFMGLFYRIVLIRVIGTEGVGLYQLAYPLYTFLLVFSVSGIPVALAKLVSEKLALGRGAEAYRIFRVALNLSLIFGGSASLLLIVFAKPIIPLLHLDARGYYTIVAIAPAIFLVSVMAAYRGFFQGMQNMKPTAYSQVIEQIVRMITIVGLSYALLPFGLEKAAAGATFSAVTGAAFGLIVMLTFYYRKKREFFTEWQQGETSGESVWQIIRRIAEYALPVIVAASVVQLMSLVSLFFVPGRLQVAGFSVEEATILYGELTGVALVLVHFPEIITVALQTSLIPSISSAFALGQHELIKERTRLGIRLALLISTPSAAGLFILARPLCDIIFDAPNAADSLRILAFGVIFIALQQISSGILQGIGKVRVPARNLLIGAGVNALLTFLLTGTRLNIQGAALATMLAFSTAAVLNLIQVKRNVHVGLEVRSMLLRPLISAGVMTVSVFLSYYGLAHILRTVNGGTALSLFVAVGIGASVYFFMMILIGGLTENDLCQLPGTDRIISPLRRLGILKA